jgi:hypothetical protein
MARAAGLTIVCLILALSARVSCAAQGAAQASGVDAVPDRPLLLTLPGLSSFASLAQHTELQTPRVVLFASTTEPVDDRSFESRPLLSARLIEVPRDVRPGQQYSRPRYALGFRSNAMKHWMKDAGVDAHTCLAPVIRLRTKLSSDREFSGTFWMHARCTFH